MKTIAICTQKGGVGKSTSASAIASGLNASGKSVLLVDADAQCNLSFAEGSDLLNLPCTLYDVFRGEPIRNAIQTLQIPSRDLITGGLRLASADLEFSGAISRELMLKRNLDIIASDYDFCILDCPPHLGLMTMNATTAADYIIIPVTMDAMALQTLSFFWDFLRNIQTYCNSSLRVAGLLVTMYDDGTSLTTRELEGQILQFAEQVNTRVFNSKIHKSQAIRSAQARRSIDVYAKNSRAACDYRSFVQELLSILESEDDINGK